VQTWAVRANACLPVVARQERPMAGGEIPSVRSQKDRRCFAVYSSSSLRYCFDRVDLAAVVSSKEPSQRYAQRVKNRP
jgi:hypothetical protein